MKGPVASFLFDAHYSVPEKTYQWRIQLDGCVRDVLTRHHTEDKPADDVQRLGELAETYYFSRVKPSQREIRDADEQAQKHAEQSARARVMGIERPAEPATQHLRQGATQGWPARAPMGHPLLEDVYRQPART
jgi:hypothetical protein